MSLTVQSPCKVNLILNVLPRRHDGFHALESLFLPVPLCDEITLDKAREGVELSCSNPSLSVGADNLVRRAAEAFVTAQGKGGARIHLQKNLPLAAGIGAGSANAAHTLKGLNQLHDNPLSTEMLHELAAQLGSDVPFFLQDKCAVATGRGEEIEPVGPIQILQGKGLLLAHPGFGVSTPWAYQALANHSERYSQPGQGMDLIQKLQTGDWKSMQNNLEPGVFGKHTVLPVIKGFFKKHGAIGALMSGSGSTMFAITEDRPAAETLRAKYHDHFGQAGWSASVSL
jgi:4-diphosphocytidyl-2-C-methyl-D-erythritol kinase